MLRQVTLESRYKYEFNFVEDILRDTISNKSLIPYQVEN